jgi:hypothetical protein
MEAPQPEQAKSWTEHSDRISGTNSPGETTIESVMALDQLTQLQEDYAQTSKLNDYEQQWYARLEKIMVKQQLEPDTPVEIKTQTLLAFFKNFNKAYLISNSVIAVDSQGRISSVPLQRLPPATIVAIVHEATPQLSNLVHVKREQASKKIAAIESLITDLRDYQRSFAMPSSSSMDESEQTQNIRGNEAPTDEGMAESGRGPFEFMGVFGRSKGSAPSIKTKDGKTNEPQQSGQKLADQGIDGSDKAAKTVSQKND